MSAEKQGPRNGGGGNLTQALRIGAGLQVVCILLPVLDLWLLGSVERHVLAAYPQWDAAEIAAERTAIILYLVIVGATGLLGWLFALAAVRRGWWERGVVTALFTVGMGVLILSAGAEGGAYDRIVPLWLGLTLLCLLALPGVTALVAVWHGTDR
ncbi:hypothetical protein ACF07Q_00215 [Nocardiopsis dassonvillei]|uniref:hypothetical protein n=1 Tax=Nocardiopsis dassonvillei TaxID=2014 RepID=UPI00157BDE8A|nr:hypothetical protein [Nocardiopsis dassonvillei]